MATPTYHEIDEDHPYIYANNIHYATYCMTTFEFNNSTLKIPSILDTGSSVTLVSYFHVKGTEIEKKLIKTDVKITGVTPGYSPIMGKLQCNVTIGENCKFHNIICYVTSQQIPCLVGNNVLRHKSVVCFNQDNVNHRITIKRLVNNEENTFEIQQFGSNLMK